MKHEDFQSPTWRRLTHALEIRLADLRELNDGQSFGPEKTAAIRGSIAEVKRILALADSASAGQAVSPGELAGEDTPA
jgi:hypothetical protein